MHQASKHGDRLRTRVERGIFKRSTRNGETRYEVSYTDSDGYQRWRTVTTLTEARRLRAELVTRVASGERVAPSKVTLEEFAAEWLEQQRSRLRPTTHRLYGSYVAQHINPRLGTRKLSAITVDDVAALIADMEQGWRYREHDGRLVRVQGKPFAAWTSAASSSSSAECSAEAPASGRSTPTQCAGSRRKSARRRRTASFPASTATQSGR
jgi:hypothetical protein